MRGRAYAACYLLSWLGVLTWSLIPGAALPGLLRADALNLILQGGILLLQAAAHLLLIFYLKDVARCLHNHLLEERAGDYLSLLVFGTLFIAGMALIRYVPIISVIVLALPIFALVLAVVLF